MLCEFQKLIYPQSIRLADPGSYMVAVYIPCEKVYDSAGKLITQIKAVGYCLPLSDKIRYDMQGRWSKNARFGIQFEVENYSEVIIPTKEGVIGYLSSGQIKGIGPKIAERIYDEFGDLALEVLDKEPQKLLSISGITESKLKKICDSYLMNRGARDVIAFLSPYGITANKAVRFYKEYGKKAIETVKNHPYKLCEISGIGFLSADKIALSMGTNPLDPRRVDEGLLYTLAEAEGRGHLCLERRIFIKEALKLLNTEGLTEDMAACRAQILVNQGELVCYGSEVFRSKTAAVEGCLARAALKQVQSNHKCIYNDLDNDLDNEEKKLNLTLAPEQREAVKTALTSGLSIITGGPGTGKTLIQRAILDIYSNRYPRNEICCCAPTGRAARRMSQSTGREASTVHRALGLYASEDGTYGKSSSISADLIIVDEVSMLDVYLAEHLFLAVKKGSQLVLIGDADQLPSVGPGAVLSEMIASGCIPTVRLDRVFRQNSGSRIATNARVIRHGNLSLEYGTDFKFYESPEMIDSASTIVDLYMQETALHGIDNVALLTPLRQKTETGVNALNELIRDRVNPPASSKAETPEGRGKKYREGDKVMQIKNFEDVNNGDIGYIRKIVNMGDDTMIRIDFGDGRIKEYDVSEMDMVDLGYASTVHKSQGAEYSTVIINLQCAHHIMLTRPLVYTAITRGKSKVIIVGERRALCIAIKRIDTDKRGTCLAKRMQDIINSKE
ncbi:MAG: ATP-dependent RecD-like DNA helicase [Clostridia bacterium]|nr:ATP-dependent RecD-like DNA helicase [Clostridia bacterium]